MRENPAAARMKNCDSSSFSPSRQTRKGRKGGPPFISHKGEGEGEKAEVIKFLFSSQPRLICHSFFPFSSSRLSEHKSYATTTNLQGGKETSRTSISFPPTVGLRSSWWSCWSRAALSASSPTSSSSPSWPGRRAGSASGGFPKRAKKQYFF